MHSASVPIAVRHIEHTQHLNIVSSAQPRASRTWCQTESSVFITLCMCTWQRSRCLGSKKVLPHSFPTSVSLLFIWHPYVSMYTPWLSSPSWPEQATCKTAACQQPSATHRPSRTVRSFPRASPAAFQRRPQQVGRKQASRNHLIGLCSQGVLPAPGPN